MNNPLVRVLLIGLLLMFVVSPFAALAPLLVVLLVGGIGWAAWSVVQAFFTADVDNDEKASFEPSNGD